MKKLTFNKFIKFEKNKKLKNKIISFLFPKSETTIVCEEWMNEILKDIK